MSCSTIQPTGFYQQPTTSLSFDLDEMIAKAKAYSKDDSDLFEYIVSILIDKKFQINPKGYLDAWRKDTGQYLEAEDPASAFFEENFKFIPK
jgi:hypothetical protein